MSKYEYLTIEFHYADMGQLSEEMSKIGARGFKFVEWITSQDLDFDYHPSEIVATRSALFIKESNNKLVEIK